MNPERRASVRSAGCRRRPVCRRCGSDRIVDYGARYGCGSCGATWQAG